jgi:hypothetical protein
MKGDVARSKQGDQGERREVAPIAADENLSGHSNKEDRKKNAVDDGGSK